MKEDNILAQIRQAQNSTRAADDFIARYLPFIRSETAKFLKRFPQEGEDELGVAMFAFYEALTAYRPDKGAFLNLAALTIRSRLIDYYRKERRHDGVISLELPSSEEDSRSLGDQIADKENELEKLHEREASKEEIQEYAVQLCAFGLSLSVVADNCPKQERTLSACMRALDFARSSPEILEELLRTQKLPLARLTEGAGVERKTLERHRKYMVAILLAYTNGFEIIRGHLKRIKRKEAARL